MADTMEVGVKKESVVDFDSDYVSFSDKNELKSNENSVSANSLLALLDDKNRSIASLKKQIHNQKVQLGFYLHRGLNSKKVLQLADHCVPQETEENMQLNLAMSRFCKHTGLKSRIMSLHGRMVDLEKRLMRVALEQEDLIQSAFSKLIEFAKKGNGFDGNAVLSFLAEMNSEQLDTLVKILESTNKLRKDLDMFRTCCDRLIVIEDERNALVEQVYAMPVAQRLSYGVLLAAQYENIRLEKEVEEIKRDQFMLQRKLCLIQGKAPSATSIKSITDLGAIQKMLEAVNFEAVDILTMAKEQKDKYTNEIRKLKDNNASLLKQVIALQAVAKDKKDLECKMASTIKELHTVKETGQNKTKSYSRKLETLLQENAELKEKLKHYCCIEEQVNYLQTQVEDVDLIRNERDYCKAQVEDLQAIRSAYEQLVENYPARDYEARIRKQTKKIEELERIRHQMDLELKNKAKVVADQDKQIKHLLLIIQKMAAHKERETNTVHSQTSWNRPASVTPKNWMDPHSSNELASTSSFLQNACILAKKQEQEFCRANSISFPKTVQSSLMSTTSVEIQSVNSEGKTESLKATLKSSTCLEGTIQVSNSSTLSFNLSCKKTVADKGPASGNDELHPITCEQTILDEFELMKDSSRETVAVTLASINECDVEQKRVVENAHSQDDALQGGNAVNEESKDGEDVQSTREVDLEENLISGQLQQLTTDLDETLSRPDGKDILVNTMKAMYNHVCFLRKEN